MRSSLFSWHVLGMAGDQLGETGQQLGEKKRCIGFIRLQQAWRLLRCFSTRVDSYPGSPGMCLNQTQQLGRHSSSSQSSSRRRWQQRLKTQLHLKRSSSIASSWHPSPFSFCSCPSKPQDNSFFRSTRLVKVWKCFDGHVFQLLASSAGVRRDVPSKGRLYENLLLSASRLPFHLVQVLYSLAEGLNILPLFFL